MERKQNSQTVAWFWDFYTRDLLDLDPPYQRLSVWNQAFKDYFIDTILMDYPSPAIFLYEEITPDGVSKYNVVDGKQRLTAIFEFVRNGFPVAEITEEKELVGRKFKDFDDKIKTSFWGYQFSIEYVPTNEAGKIDKVFDRINRNTACLTEQELRHARFRGLFITTAEELSDWMTETMPQSFLNINPPERRRMKDVEFMSQLFLLLEDGQPRSYYSLSLDKPYSDRDHEWEHKDEVSKKFRNTTQAITDILKSADGKELFNTRLRNRADFYLLFGAVNDLMGDGILPEPVICASRLKEFIELINSGDQRRRYVKTYHNSVASSRNQANSRKKGISVLKKVLLDNK